MASPTLPYLLHCRERDVQVAHSGLRKPFRGLTLFEESKTSAGLLTGISYLQREHGVFMLRVGKDLQVLCWKQPSELAACLSPTAGIYQAYEDGPLLIVLIRFPTATSKLMKTAQLAFAFKHI